MPLYYIKNTYYDDAGITGSGFFTNEQTFFIVSILILILGLLLVAFSKEKVEDEQIAQLRLQSLQWAIYLNYLVFVLCVLFIYGTNFLAVILYNTITPLLIFIIRFRWKLYQLNRQYKES